MEERNFANLVERVAEKVPSAKQAIRQAFEAVRDNGELLTLSVDEVNLLEAYQLWKRTAESASGVFHYRKISK